MIAHLYKQAEWAYPKQKLELEQFFLSSLESNRIPNLSRVLIFPCRNLVVQARKFPWLVSSNKLLFHSAIQMLLVDYYRSTDEGRAHFYLAILQLRDNQ